MRSAERPGQVIGQGLLVADPHVRERGTPERILVAAAGQEVGDGDVDRLAGHHRTSGDDDGPVVEDDLLHARAGHRDVAVFIEHLRSP